MSDVTGAWHDTVTGPAERSFSDKKSVNFFTNFRPCDTAESALNGTRLSLSSSQKVDSGILASILGGGRLGILISDRLIAHYDSLAMVVSAPVVELCRFGGLTKSQVLTIKAVHAAALRLVSSELNTKSVLSDRKALINYLVASYSRSNVESFRVLFLDSSNHLIADELMANGTINHVLPYPREIIKRAIELNSTVLVLVHNHPSGDPTPSLDDIDSTNLIRNVASALQIRIYDHIIVACGNIVSFRDLGLLASSCNS